MKTQILIQIALVLVSLTARSEILRYSCNYSGSKAPKVIQFDTKPGSNAVLFGQMQPTDKNLPMVRLLLGNNYNVHSGYQFEQSVRPTLIIRNHHAVTAIYGKKGERLMASFSSGELLVSDEASPGGNPVTNEFDVVCVPI